MNEIGEKICLKRIVIFIQDTVSIYLYQARYSNTIFFDWKSEILVVNKTITQLQIHSNIKTFDSVIFHEYPDIEQKLWPAHCIQGSYGSELHPNLTVVDEKTDRMKRSVVYVKKGCKSDIDSYSAFFDNCKLNETTLNADLKKHGITDLYVCGLAADVCVGNLFDSISQIFTNSSNQIQYSVRVKLPLRLTV